MKPLSSAVGEVVGGWVKEKLAWQTASLVGVVQRLEPKWYLAVVDAGCCLHASLVVVALSTRSTRRTAGVAWSVRNAVAVLLSSVEVVTRGRLVRDVSVAVMTVAPSCLSSLRS